MNMNDVAFVAKSKASCSDVDYLGNGGNGL
jgi:hypothetical protein